MMQDYPPSKFAASLAVICAIIITLIAWAGLSISETLTTNLMIAWGIVSMCHAIEWHTRQ